MNYDTSNFSEEELAYLNSGGAEPPPASEAKPEPAAEPQAETDETPEAAAPEPAAEPADPDVEVSEHDEETGEDGKPKKRRKVDYGAYLRQKNEAEAARKEREELREKYNALERERAAVNERIRIAQEMSQRQQAEQQQRQQAEQQTAAPRLRPAPNKLDNPLDYMDWQDERAALMEEQLGQVTGFVRQTAEERQQRAALQQLDRAYWDDGQKAKAEVPEFVDAYNHFYGVTRQVVAQENPNWTPDQVEREFERRERLLAVQAHQSQKRPAQLIWERAVAYGFRPAAQRAAQAPVQPDPAAEQARIDAAARGQAQNVSLSNTGRPSGAVSGAMTLDKLTRMSDDDRYRYLQANPDAIQRIMGEA